MLVCDMGKIRLAGSSGLPTGDWFLCASIRFINRPITVAD